MGDKMQFLLLVLLLLFSGDVALVGAAADETTKWDVIQSHLDHMADYEYFKKACLK